MSEKNKKPLTLKGIVALIGAGLLYLVAQLTGIDLTGKGDDKNVAESPKQEAPAEPGTGSKKKVQLPPITTPKKKADPVKETEPAKEKAKRNDLKKVQQAFANNQSSVQVEIEGRVVHILPDDNYAPRHQLFLLELENDITLKISHNIDVAPYIDNIAKGDTVRLYGEYEWNAKGGVVHWTHKKSRSGSHPDGWILHKGKKYW